MKKTFTLAAALCLTLTLLAGTAFAVGTDSTTAVISGSSSTGTAEILPIDILQYPDRLEIRKVYELSPEVDPGLLPRDGFERNGVAFECADILREVVIGQDEKTVTVTETAESKKNDMDTILSLFPQFKEVEDEDGFTGTLLLNTATIKSEVTGYGSSSSSYTVSRSYPNLADADMQYIPKTIDDGGRTLQLQDVQWRSDNTMNVDDYEITDRYTAIVTYAGTKTSSYVKGYTITADYTGEIVRKGVTAIRYTVIFTGTEIPVEDEPTPEPIVTPTPEPIPTTEAVPAAEPDNNWLPILLSAVALLGSGAGIVVAVSSKKRGATPT